MDQITPVARCTPTLATLSSIAAAVVCLCGSPALAQAQAAEKPATPTKEGEPTAKLDAVVVTANRKVEALRNVPMAVDVITAKELDKYLLLDAKDIAKLAPGVEMDANDGRQNVASMRGVSFNPDTGVPVAAVGVHINEVPVSANVAFNVLYDLGQVEVLRGPQGTLRGQMTPAGAITMATRKADLSRLGGEVLLLTDDKGGQNVKGAFNLPLVSDKLALRFAAVRDENRLNHVHQAGTGDRSKSESDSHRLSLAWQLTDDLRIDFMTQKLKVDNRQFRQVVGDGVVTPFSLGRPAATYTEHDRTSVSEVPDIYKTDADLSTLKASWSLDEHRSLSLIAGHQNVKLNQGFDRDANNVIPGTQVWQQIDSRLKSDSVELIYADEGWDFWNFTLGAFHERNTSQADVDVASGAFKLAIPGGSTSKALFTRHSFKLGKDLTLDAGARYSELTSERQSTASVPGYTFPPSVPANYAHVVDKPLTWGLSLSQRFGRELTGYVSMGHSFRPGTYQVGVLNPIAANLLGMAPEKSDAFELGLKGDLWDRAGSFNLAAFVQKYKGFIDYVPDVTYQYVEPFSGTTQRDTSPFNSSGNARVAGLEGQLMMRLRPQWDANIAGSWVSSRYTSGQRPCDDSNGDGVPDANGPTKIPAGQQVAMCPMHGSIAELPRFSLSTSTEYRFEAGSVRPYVGAQLNHRPGFHSQKINYDYRAFSNLSLFAGVRSLKGDWELGLFVKNALDQERVMQTTTTNGKFPVPGLGQFDSGYRGVVLTAPRQIGLSGRLTF